MNETGAKVLAMMTLGIGSTLAGLLPAFLSRTSRWSPRDSLFRSLLLCFGAGVLLTTSVIHMLPESREILGNFAEITFCGGFFLIYLIDEAVHIFSKRTLDDLGRQYTTAEIEHHHHNYGAVETTLLVASEPLASNAPLMSGCHVSSEPCTTTRVGRSGLLLALTMHAILEGLAVGLQSSVKQVLLLLGAISTHKLVVAFCLGAELLSIEPISIWMHIVSVFVFSFGSALGILVGMIIESINEPWTQTVLGIMQGVAGGTLLYVTLSEVLPRERARWHRASSKAGSFQFCSTAFGFILMFTLNYYLDGEHFGHVLINKQISQNYVS